MNSQSMNVSPKVSTRPGLIIAAVVAATAIGLAALFWWPLFCGGGLVGGDIYSYYLPQKVVYADLLARGQMPLWNDRVGHGYPIVGESQTGAFSPFSLTFYSLLSVNDAYNVNHLAHYFLAFLFTWLYARSIGLSRWASGLCGLIYVYGWFPPRCCWEWAIVGGTWLPAALWCSERFFATRLWRYAFGLSGALTLQLLAGHFNLAFLTDLTLMAYLPLRLFFARGDLPEATRSRSSVCLAVCVVAVAGSFALSAAQIAPSWELKTLSQRETPGPNHRLAQGSIPLGYWSQMICPWHWYALDMNRDAALAEWQSVLGAPTNQVEAHLYFGLVPLALALGAIVLSISTKDRVAWIWAGLGTVALFYTTGWFLGVTRFVPGFSFFQDPGRYGVITTLAVAVLSGKGLDRLRATGSVWLGLGVLVAFAGTMWTALKLTAQALTLAEQTGTPSRFTLGGFAVSDGLMTTVSLVGVVAIIVSLLSQYLARGTHRGLAADFGRRTLTACVLCASTIDLWLVSRVVSYSQMVDDPPIRYLSKSPVRALLSRTGGKSRVLAPGANLPSVLGAASTPVYLTFGPAAYVDPKLTMPESPVSKKIEWLRRAGVTHVLSFEPLDLAEWPARKLWQGMDPLLNRAWARYAEPLYLYELGGSRGRIAWEKPERDTSAEITELGSSRVVAEASSPAGGRLIFTDLMYPGWTVSLDGKPAEARTFEGMFRAVDVPAGRHTVIWSYRPRAVYWGLIGSGITFLLLAAVAHVRYWHPRRLNFLDEARPQ